MKNDQLIWQNFVHPNGLGWPVNIIGANIGDWQF